MSTAARAASRGAGRGTSLSVRARPTPVTQLPHRRQHQPVAPSTAGRGTNVGHSAPVRKELTNERSSLTASVLQRRNPERRNQSGLPRGRGHGRGAGHGRTEKNPFYAEAISGGRSDPDSKRKGFDWYNSTARREALAGLAQATSELKEVSKRPGDVEQTTQPFAWADLSDVADQLPDGHWAHAYVSGVASSIERNDGMNGDQKEKVLGEVLQALGRLSRENDEQFQDAES